MVSCSGKEKKIDILVEKQLTKTKIVSFGFKALDIYLSSADVGKGLDKASNDRTMLLNIFKTKLKTTLMRKFYIELNYINFKDVRFRLESDIGGFLWWLLIRFCKTKLKDEQAEDKWARNILYLCLVGILIALIVIKFF